MSEPEVAPPPPREDPPGLEPLAADLDALANPQRLRLLHLLTRPRYAEEIADALGMSRQSALKHIDKLLERGFVRALNGRRPTGPVTEYVVVPSRLFALGIAVGDLGNLEPQGGPQVKVAERTILLGPDGVTEVVAPAPLRSPHVLLVNGPQAGARFELGGERKRWTIGRAEDRDLRVTHDPFVSGRHAEIQVAGTGHVLVDAFSANGTFLNFARVPRGGRVPLKVGDLVAIGHTLVVYQSE